MSLSDRHRQLIDQAKATQRAARAPRQSPVPNQIGDRDPVTGQHAAIYPDGSQTTQGRKLYDAHSRLNDSVTGLPVGDGTIGLLGPKGQASPLALPAKEGVRGIATSGSLKTNEVGYLRGQVWNYEEPEDQKTTGVVMWLDSDWYSTQAQGATPAACFQALKKMFSVFSVDRKKVIYTLNPAVYPYFDSFANLKNPRLQPFFEAQHYKVLATTIEVALAKRGTFWLPLLSFGTIYTLTDTDFANLIKIAKTGGLYVSGEYNLFTAYNDFLLRGLGIRPEVTNAYNSGASTAPADYQGHRKLNGVTFRGQAYNRFIGLSETEILAVESVTQDPVFAFFKPSSLATP